MKNILKFLFTVGLLICPMASQAVPSGASYNQQYVAIPPVIPTNTTVWFTNCPATALFVTNADGSVYSNLLVAPFIGATAERFVALEFKTACGVASNGTAGATNTTYYLTPAVLSSTNGITLPIPTNNTVAVTFPGTNFPPPFDFNHLVTIVVPTGAAAGQPSDFTTNLDGAGIGGWFLVGIKNDVSIGGTGGLITNTLAYSAKSGAP